jgi:glutamate synthase (NADPH/NADH) large chain
MVELEPIDPEDRQTIKDLLRNHLQYTGSERAKAVLDNFDRDIKKFVKVMPIEYKRLLESGKIKKQSNSGETPTNGKD